MKVMKRELLHNVRFASEMALNVSSGLLLIINKSLGWQHLLIRIVHFTLDYLKIKEKVYEVKKIYNIKIKK